MNSDVFQAALAATARIACCAVLVSCQKTPEKPTPPMKEHAEQQAGEHRSDEKANQGCCRDGQERTSHG